MKRYDHTKIEKKWQKVWEKQRAYFTKDAVRGKKNEYILTEFPYPSGDLHVGHWYAFAVMDIFARFRRAKGSNVLYPIGFDAFGLPAENAAIKHNLNPRTWTLQNIKRMKRQLMSMGALFDWSREVITCNPDYYKWTQWQFLQFFKKGLAYQKETPVNWCPADKTVLANEQVIEGRCERCGAEVEQRTMVQWNLRITDYADRLLNDLEPLNWPKQIKEAQRNWIGRSEGAEIDFAIADSNEKITVFTTRPDTLYGATYLVLAPEHPLCKRLTFTNTQEVRAYLEKTKKKSDLERQEQRTKTGVRLAGVAAINPATHEHIPVYIADYVLPHYGTGAIMAVPAHDERDFAFANAYGLPIRQVIMPVFGAHQKRPDAVRRRTVNAFVRNKQGDILLLKWRAYEWLTGVIGGIEEGESPASAARREVLEETGYAARPMFVSPISIESHYFAEHKNEWRAREDYAILLELESDTPAPISQEEAEKHELCWMPQEQAVRMHSFKNNELALKLALGHIGAYTEATHGESTVLIHSGPYDGMSIEEAKQKITETFGRPKKTYRLRDWVVSRQRYWGVPIPIIHCGTCGAVPVPERELPVTLPAVQDYLPAGDGKSPLAKATRWVRVKCPQCKGRAIRETDTLDTFVDSSWYFLRYTDPHNKKHFADKKKQKNWMPVAMYSGGAEHTTMHLLYSRFWHKVLYDLKLVREKEPYLRRMNRGLILGPDGQKMSKSKGNVINPDEVVSALGADTVRLYLAFIGPYNEPGSYPWNPDSIIGVRRFLERVWRLGQNTEKWLTSARRRLAENEEVEQALHEMMRKVEADCAELKFNTAIAAMMSFLNTAESKGITTKQYTTFIRVLAPFAPHIAEELWHILGKKRSVHREPWPRYHARAHAADMTTIAIQINGILRGQVRVPARATKEEQEHAARDAVQNRLAGRTITRVIVVPGRIVNFVAA